MPDKEPIDVFRELDLLCFPAGEFLAAGSAIMAVKGIRPAYDLDIIVSEKLFEICRVVGDWELRPWTRRGLPGKDWLKKGKIELLRHLNTNKQIFLFEDLLVTAEIVRGVPFLSLQQLMEFKRDYGRQKDFDDVELILNYLQGKGDTQ